MASLINPIYDPINPDYFAAHEKEQEEFYAKIETVPKPIYYILFGDDTPEIIENLAQSFKLKPAQSEELSHLIRKILITDIYLGDMVPEIASRLTIGQDTAKEIANGLLTKLFAPALEEIKKLHMEKFPGKQLNQPAAPATQSKPTPTTENKNVNPNNVLDLRNKS